MRETLIDMRDTLDLFARTYIAVCVVVVISMATFLLGSLLGRLYRRRKP